MSRPYVEDTIVAIATPLGEGGVGMIRISGPDALNVSLSIFSLNRTAQIESHRIYHGLVIGPDRTTLDEAILSYMKAPKSYTGEDVVEITCHGGVGILTEVLEGAVKAGARLAERGEFTKRAFLNGKMDLAEAEAVIDLIKARTKEGVRVAAGQLRGALSRRIKGLREALLSSLAGIEANIDFPEDIEAPTSQKLKGGLASVLSGITDLLETAQAGRIMREGLATAIVGKPNTGKSSILNALLREDRAIVTDIPGTTRDAIEERLNVKGIPINIIDTAGYRGARDKIERLSQEKAKEALEKAELVLCVIDVSSPLTEEDRATLRSCTGKKAIAVLNKIDLGEKAKAEDIRGILDKAPIVKTSALNGKGIPELEDAIAKLVISDRIIAGNEAIVSNSRHRECLVRAKESLERAIESAGKDVPHDFVAIDLKGAIVALGEVTGETVTDEIIDRIFEEFCVGK